MEIRLVSVSPAERDVLYRLLQYSLYEESAYDGNQNSRVYDPALVSEAGRGPRRRPGLFSEAPGNVGGFPVPRQR